MGNIVVSQFVALDGVFQDPGGTAELDRGGWSFKGDRGEEGMKFGAGRLEQLDDPPRGRRRRAGRRADHALTGESGAAAGKTCSSFRPRCR